MAVTCVRQGEFVEGNKRYSYGTFTGSSTGGDLYTGLQRVEGLILTPKSAVTPTEECAVVETFPCYDPVTIAVTSDVDGYWLAEGF